MRSWHHRCGDKLGLGRRWDSPAFAASVSTSCREIAYREHAVSLLAVPGIELYTAPARVNMGKTILLQWAFCAKSQPACDMHVYPLTRPTPPACSPNCVLTTPTLPINEVSSILLSPIACLKVFLHPLEFIDSPVYRCSSTDRSTHLTATIIPWYHHRKCTRYVGKTLRSGWP